MLLTKEEAIDLIKRQNEVINQYVEELISNPGSPDTKYLLKTIIAIAETNGDTKARHGLTYIAELEITI